MKIFIYLFLVFLMFISCKGDRHSTRISQADLAQTICHCAMILQEYNVQLQRLAETGNMGQLSDEMKRGDVVFKESVECITRQIPSKMEQNILENIHMKVDEYCQLSSRMKSDLIQKVTELTTNK